MRKLPDFDELKNMSPEEIEKVRQECVNDIIESCEDEDQKRRLKGLQFQIDMERRKAKTPMAACIKISEMMHDSFHKLREALNELQDLREGKTLTIIKEEDLPEEIERISNVTEIDFKRKDDEC